jgi:hypothetical protein
MDQPLSRGAIEQLDGALPIRRCGILGAGLLQGGPQRRPLRAIPDGGCP